jgi:hypothetical protein
MKRVFFIIGYFLIALSVLTLIIELMPVETTDKIIIWGYSTFFETDYHSTYIKVVPSTNSYSLIVTEFIVGLLLIFSAKRITNKNTAK